MVLLHCLQAEPYPTLFLVSTCIHKQVIVVSNALTRLPTIVRDGMFYKTEKLAGRAVLCCYK